MILSIETSSSLGSWALFEDGQLIETATFEGRASSALVASLENSKLKTLKLTCPPLRGKPATLLVGVGPGSFGGIRVAIATAQGMAQAWGSTIIPVRSSSALAWKHRNVSFLGIFADAKRNQNFFTAYEQGRLTRPAILIPKEETETYLGKCTLALSPDPLTGVPTYEHPSAIDLVHHHLSFGPEKDLAPEPVYLHPPLVPKI